MSHENWQNGRKLLLAVSKREEYGDKAVGYVEVKREGYLCTVKARICPEHRVGSKPYIVICTVDEKDDEIKKITCQDCAASTGGCKHAIAFLMWLHRRSEEPEPTATVCYWKKSTLSQVGLNIKYMLIREINNPKTKPNLPSSDTFFERVINEIQSKQNNFQISRHCILLNPSLFDVSLHQILLQFIKAGGVDVNNFLIFS
ncbi:uncharacterized protein LOC127278577 [Leptopilina boulardi]|uniref:uncharacterized protein LOC127278577 n=1 Tax=Leptopilina boulardi TaxID=63433 RepID=UPI0021F56A4A|nr:uncharacterized protein LOC127278577 [Leptopilina boulardi]